MQLSSFVNKQTLLPTLLLQEETSQPSSRLNTSNLDFSILVELQRLHQTQYAAEGVQTHDAAVVDTGGGPLFTHQVCVEFIVGSGPKYPTWAHQVYLDYFYNLPTSLPPICPLGTCWVFSKSTH